LNWLYASSAYTLSPEAAGERENYRLVVIWELLFTSLSPLFCGERAEADLAEAK
jgi:hypothetical protein